MPMMSKLKMYPLMFFRLGTIIHNADSKKDLTFTFDYIETQTQACYTLL